MKLILNYYQLELESEFIFLYLPWHTIAITTVLVIAYKIYKRKKNK